MKIAIVGHGFVGKAVEYGFPTVEKVLIDPIYGTSVKDLKDSEIKVSFVCVPTPMTDDGSVDSSIVESVIEKLLELTNSIVVLKSTVTPSVIKRILELSNADNRFVYNPEFLREKTANTDFINPDFHVFGGPSEAVVFVEDLYFDYSICLMDVPIFKVNVLEASFIKYGINDFLATKVLWYNQYYDLIKNYPEVSYDVVKEVIGTDPRIGHSHMNVPGHDGKRGYGGACFAKDTMALLKFAEEHGYDFTTLREVIRKNQEYRSTELDDREKAQHVRFDHKI